MALYKLMGDKFQFQKIYLIPFSDQRADKIHCQPVMDLTFS